MLLVAEVLKPQGINGELKLRTFVDDPSQLLGVKNFYINGNAYPVQKLRLDGTFAYAKLSGVKDRNEAERLRGQEIYLSDEEKPVLPEGAHYVSEILGCSLYAGEERLGTVTDILQNGSADVFCVAGKRNFMFPYVEGVITSIDLRENRLTADPDALARVAVYED